MNAIAAADLNWGIGRQGKLLARIPADMKYFRKMTEGKTVIMGRKTFDSLPGRKPLKGRVNIVVTSGELPDYPNLLTARSVEEAVEKTAGVPGEDVFVIGGGKIYRAMLPLVDTAYITRIEYAYDADTYFPNLDTDPEWTLASEGEEQTCFDLIYRFNVYRRRT